MILDAGVIIALLNADDRHYRVTCDLLIEAAGERRLTPQVTLAESLVAHAEAGTHVRALRRIEQLGITAAEGIGTDPMSLARMRVETHLRMPDCIPLLACEQERESLATFDERLAFLA